MPPTDDHGRAGRGLLQSTATGEVVVDTEPELDPQMSGRSDARSEPTLESDLVEALLSRWRGRTVREVLVEAFQKIERLAQQGQNIERLPGGRDLLFLTTCTQIKAILAALKVLRDDESEEEMQQIVQSFRGRQREGPSPQPGPSSSSAASGVQPTPKSRPRSRSPLRGSRSRSRSH